MQGLGQGGWKAALLERPGGCWFTAAQHEPDVPQEAKSISLNLLWCDSRTGQGLLSVLGETRKSRRGCCLSRDRSGAGEGSAVSVL